MPLVLLVLSLLHVGQQHPHAFVTIPQWPLLRVRITVRDILEESLVHGLWQLILVGGQPIEAGHAGEKVILKGNFLKIDFGGNVGLLLPDVYLLIGVSFFLSDASAIFNSALRLVPLVFGKIIF